MGRRAAWERWRDFQLEEHVRFRKSPDWNRLRERGLAILGEEHQVTKQKLWDFTTELGPAAPAWLEYIGECKAVGERYALGAGTVIDSCLVSGYRPEVDQIPIGPRGVDVTVVTTAEYGSQAFENLYAHASDLNLTVQIRGGPKFIPSRQGFVIRGDGVVKATIPWWPVTQLPADEHPPAAAGFTIRVESSPGVPHELVAETARRAAQAGDELARRLGYPVPLRRRKRSVSQRD